MRKSATETMDDLVRIKHLKLEKQGFTPMIDYIKVSGVTFWEYPFFNGRSLKIADLRHLLSKNVPLNEQITDL